MTINKRLRYFRTEEEYQEFYEQQRQACDSGTLELLETTVCCITHGDTDTPDEYLPSHEPGDENVIMHYNANDDIRYIPFINPMWTIRGIYIEGTTPVNALGTMVTLPDVIDGNQLTEITSDFVKRLNNFPKFNVKNITTFSYTSSQKFNITSEWPSLTSFSVVRPSGFSWSEIPVFDDNTLNAPNLQTVLYDAYLSIVQDFPFITSRNIQSLSASFTDLVIDVNSKLTSTENLSYLRLQQSNFSYPYTPYYNTHTIRLHYEGEGLQLVDTQLYGGDNNGVVNFNITGNAQNVELLRLILNSCDLSVSTITDLTINGPNSPKICLADCTASALTLQPVTSWLSAGNDTLKLINFTDILLYSCSFSQYIVELNDSDNRLSGNLTINTNNIAYPDVIWDCNRTTRNYVSINANRVNNLTINFSNTDYPKVDRIYITGYVKKLIIPEKKVISPNVYLSSDVETIDSIVDWYYPSAGSSSTLEHTDTSKIFIFFKIHIAKTRIIISAALDTLRLVIGRKYVEGSGILGELSLRVNNDISACDVSFPTNEDGVDYMYNLEIYFEKNVSIQTIINVLNSVDPAFSVYQRTPTYSTLTIYDTQYSTIEQDYPTTLAIIRKFKTVDIITVQ